MLTHRRVQRSTALFITLLVVAFILMTVDVRSSGDGVAETLREGTQAVVAPVQQAADTVVGPVADAINSVGDYFGLRSENERLRLQVEELRAQLAQAEALAQENEQLRIQLNLELPEELARVVARVQAGGVTNFDHVVVIDRGSSSGIGRGMPVVNAQGLLGRVETVTEGSATVKLITDPTHAVTVRVVDSGDLGVAIGRGSGDLALEINNAAGAIAAGELVLTDASTRFPPGLVVGIVAADASPEGGILIRSRVAPAVDFNRLDFVSVLLFTQGELAPEGDTTPVGEVPAGQVPPGELPGQVPGGDVPAGEDGTPAGEDQP